MKAPSGQFVVMGVSGCGNNSSVVDAVLRQRVTGRLRGTGGPPGWQGLLQPLGLTAPAASRWLPKAAGGRRLAIQAGRARIP